MNPVQFETVHLVQPRSLQYTLLVACIDREPFETCRLRICVQTELRRPPPARTVSLLVSRGPSACLSAELNFEFVRFARFPCGLQILAVLGSRMLTFSTQAALADCK